jgi:hypothetical protein
MGLFDDADEWASDARSRLDEDAAKGAAEAEERSRYPETVAPMLQEAVETLVRFDVPKISAVLRDGSEISGWKLMSHSLDHFLTDAAVLYPRLPLFDPDAFHWVGDVLHETVSHYPFGLTQYGGQLDRSGNPLLYKGGWSNSRVSYKDFLQGSVRSAIEADTARRHAGQ